MVLVFASISKMFGGKGLPDASIESGGNKPGRHVRVPPVRFFQPKCAAPLVTVSQRVP